MYPLKKSIAEAAVAGLELGKANRALAEHWLSLWRGDALPARNQLSPSRLMGLLPNLLYLDVVPDKSVMVRLAGAGFRQVLKRELNGRDWLLEAPENHRAVRLRNLSEVARGMIMITYRRMSMLAREETANEEIVLPFAADPDGTHLVIAHADWKLDPFTHARAVDVIEPVAHDFRLLALG